TKAQIEAHYASAFGTTLAPIIVKQPSPATNYVGLPATLSVGAIGSFPLTYQWNKNGSPIAAATASSYTIPSLVASDADNYSVKVINSIDVTNSIAVNITVLPVPATPPSISGVVLHLPFNNNLTDSTGRGNNGTAIHISGTSSNVASATFVADGKV